MDFIVSIPEDVWEELNGEGVNRQTVGKFIKDELQACGGIFKPCDWRNFATKNVQVSYVIKGKKDGT